MQSSTQHTSAGPRWHGRARWSRGQVLAWGGVLLFCLALASLAYYWAGQITTDRLRVSGAQRLNAYAASLENLLDKYDFLPRTLELNKDVIALLKQPSDPALREAVNIYLERVNQQARSTTIYVVNLNGVTQASSNWREKDSFVGDNVSFRPYVRDALQRTPGGFYGVGTTRLEPGYFFAHGIYHDGHMLGVATVKVNIEKLEKTWVQGADKVMLSDEQGVVFLSSVPSWKYRTLVPLAPEVRQRLDATRQYFSHPLEALGFSYQPEMADGTRRVQVPELGQANGREGRVSGMLMQRRSLAPRNWEFIYLSDLSQARSNAQAAFIFSCVAQGFIVLLFLYVRQRLRATRQRRKAREDLQHAYDNLEIMVAERTYSLRQMTQNLSEEIAVRRQAEQKLQVTQNELFQAGKMAVLGQMSAGITHELNQPLTALRTMSDNAVVLLERGRLEVVKSNLVTISQIVGRMGTITCQLKAFARKSTAPPSAVPLQSAIANALFLVERRMELSRVDFRLHMRSPGAHAWCDSNRLEQVLVNLFNNALDAMADSELRQLTVSVDSAGSRVLIRVADSGPGMTEEMRSHLFEPFFTTKPQGQGLGLGLAISEQIVREFGGILRAESAPGGGAQFAIELQVAEQELGHD
ncbi:ATP-binding protein [Rugamonas sp. CCM 8940]|uniref:sensor histidine kinase n=1 Tax=Rugamonas sp. CCM 8940 TaxID=2765359 RepID=UPI0018F3817F|nr:ATP-binding protein [Rugamonas sp. CCM 8940]MBJ7308760.1 sensor histidine kinase [Rugamonas sp. CCM 8940]